MNRRLPTKNSAFLLLIFNPILNVNKFTFWRPNIYFFKLLFLLLLIIYSVNINGQGTTCATATVIAVNGTCRINDTPNPTGTADNGPVFKFCGTGGGTNTNNVGWYSFVVVGGPSDITITAIGNRNLAFQVFASSTNDCINLSQMVACVNDKVGSGATTNSTEAVTLTLTNGTYYIKVLNTGTSGLTLASLCLTENRVPSTGNNSLTTCSANLYDSGGSNANYANNADGYTVINPAIAGNLVSVSGTLDSEVNYDYLYIYDGAGIGGALLFKGSGTGNLPNLTSSTGPLTIRFVSDGSVNFSGFKLAISCLSPCSGTPTGGTANLSPITGVPSSPFVASVTGDSQGVFGLTFQWQIADTSTGPWSDITGQTNQTANLTAPDLPSTTKYYRRKLTCTNSGLFGTSTAVPFTTTACATPTSVATDRYLSNIKFVGTLNLDTANPTGYTATGYADYTGLAAKGKQIPGGGINVFLSTAGPAGDPLNRVKAWVDWNKDGFFNENTEKVYDTYSQTLGLNIRLSSTTFGYVVPAGTAPGFYNIRIRAYNGDDFFSACGQKDNGETEDYSFEVIADCAAKITAAPKVVRCGAGTVSLSATSTAATGFKWYDSEYGGTLLSSANTYTISSLAVGSYTYYVTATSATCESVKRTPVSVTVSPVPTITFTTSNPSICGDVGSIIVGASGDKEEITLINENFEAGLGVFTSASILSPDNTVNVNSRTIWQSKTSTFIPTEAVWFPAINSGSSKFAYATSDIQNGTVVNTTLAYNSTTINTTGFLNLFLNFDAYLSYYGSASASQGFYVEVSTDGTNWLATGTVPNPGTFQSSIGNGTHFANKLVDLSAFVGVANLRLRFRYQAGWNDGVAIDNVKLYGDKPFATPFTFSSSVAGQVFSAADCSSPVTSATSVCFKPDPALIESYPSWTITANATLKNGCVGTGSLTINNDNKYWNNPAATNDWKTTNWQPGPGVPDNTKCVIVKTPVVLDPITVGFAKNLEVQSGSLVIAGSLTVTDYVKNTTSNSDKLTVNSDANLKQITENIANTGKITVKRDSPMRRNNYTYWSSPVSGQNLYGFSPGTSTTRFYYYRESDDKFYNDTFNASTVFKPGQGYAIMAPSGFTTLQTFNGSFVGVPNNGTNTTLQFPLQLSSEVPAADKGYNLIGNPYPSNIDFDKLFTENGGSTTDQNSSAGKIIRVAYFWTNVNPNRAGSTNGTGNVYSGNAYAVYNGTGGNPATSETGSPIGITPTNIIKVGQGFIVKARTAQPDKTLVFNNTIRTTATANFFSKGSASEKDRYWLKLTSPALDVNTILIGYVPGATNEFEWDYDAPLLSVGSDSFYSALGEEKLGIQGRIYPLNPQDIVTLGTKHFDQGNYTISLGDREGVFATDQNIYLKDKQTGIITNLSEGSYTFATNIGESSTRFEIIYKPETVLATDSNVKEDLVIYRKDNDFVVKSLNKKITTVDVYDITGRLIYSSQPTSTEAVIPAEKLINSVYVLKIDRNGKISTKKILK